MSALVVQQWPIDRLIPYARNPRKNDEVVDQMAAAIKEFGFRIPIVAKSDGTVVDGHLRLKAALKLGLTEAPVALADELTETQVKAFRLLANRSANWAEWDEELLTLELEELADAGFDLELTGFSEDELADFQASDILMAANDNSENAVPEVPVDPVTKMGDIWQLGKHRLMCGDSTALKSIKIVLDGKMADMVFTDPPYNVDLGNTRKEQIRGTSRTIMNDNLGEGFEKFLHQTCQNIMSVCQGGIYICMSSAEMHTLQKTFLASGGKFSTFVIWAKSTFSVGAADYQRQYEPILYGWKQGVKRHWCGARDQGDVWFINRPAKNDLHPTMKPMELVERAIRNSSKKDDIVLDCFGGSGTTLIACEKTNRQCRMVELDPKYCDVIVKRWEDFTGKKAALVK